jgi:glutamyl-tRNA(Gln) amidotransferase subunit D
MAPHPPEDPWERVRGLSMGHEIEIVAQDGRRWRGTLVPSHAFSGERILQLKLASGYNIGVRLDPTARVEIVAPPPPDSTGPVASRSAGTTARPRAVADGAPSTDSGPVVVLTTGGTIASRVDYRTGGVRPVHDEQEILEFYPGLDRDGPVSVRPVFDLLSENLGPEEWTELAQRAARAFREGARGVVVAHGTDTLGYTAAALSFLLDPVPGPVVLVGAQRSPDRPSTDGALNLLAAVRLARHPTLAEVVVAMHAGESDDRIAVHRGTRVRKMHSTRRDAFESLNDAPLGFVEGERIELSPDHRRRSSEPTTAAAAKLDTRGVLIWFYPGLRAEDAARQLGGKRGAILAGTGLGHVASAHLGWIREAIRRGAVLAMTTQCLEGLVDPFVYETGRELARAGVLYLGDMLPETAYAKLLWALGQSGDPRRVRARLEENRVGERSERRLERPEGRPS